MKKTANERAREWAAQCGVKESQRWYRDCLHGLTGQRPRSGLSLNCDCPRGDSETLDHSRLWNRDGKPAFLLAQVYGDVSPESVGAARVAEYAASFGVRAVIGDPADDWYGFGTTPVRYEPCPPLTEHDKRVFTMLADRLDPAGPPARHLRSVSSKGGK
jgi:hypothetical protein